MQPPAASKNFSTPPSAAAPHICLLPRLFRLLLLLCLLLVPSSIHNVHGRPHDQQHPFAQGNLFIVFHPRTGRSSEHSPQLANLSSLWCQATSNGNDRLRIKKADFVRVLPKPEKIIPASRYNGARDRAFLDFGLVPITSIGKYRCEIQTQDGDFVTGNLFVYMRPILLLNSTQRLDPVEEGNSFAWIGQTSKASEGDDAVLNCPAIGYPCLRFDDTSAIMASNDDSSDGFDSVSERRKYLLTAQSLYIREVNDADEGTYKCVATNEFPLHAKSTNDEKSREFYLSLEQHLRITNSLSWLLPLLIILAGLLLLVIIIWGCSQWKRYKYDQYNVAQKEKELGKKDGVMDGQQKMPLEPDDVED